MASAQAIVQLLGTDKCSQETVAEFERLLGGTKQSTNATPKTTTQASQRVATQRATAKGQHKALEKPRDASSPGDRYLLATQTVNAGLKILSSNPRKPPSSTDRRSPHKPSAEALRRRSSSSARGACAPPELSTTAECIGRAFAYLRTAEARVAAAQVMPSSQLESGMIAFIGRLITHGLDSLAGRELRVLKRRLERLVEKQAPSQEKSLDKSEKETLADLLQLRSVDIGSAALPLLASYQLLVLRLLVQRRRGSVTEAALEHLRPSSIASPSNILLEIAKLPGQTAKVARQLETYAQCLLSLCAPTSSSQDVIANGSKLYPSAEVSFELQQLALAARRSWWKLAGHKFDTGRDVLEPCSRYITAFSRRSALSAQKKYDTTNTAWNSIVLASTKQDRCKTEEPQKVLILRTLSALAQAAAELDAATNWIEEALDIQLRATDNDVQLAISYARWAAISLERKADYSKIDKLLSSLTGPLKGSQTCHDSLLAELVPLRKLAVGICLRPIEDDGELAQQERAFAVLAACVSFLVRYIGMRTSADAEEKARSKFEERLQVATRFSKTTVDTALAAAKSALAAPWLRWQDFDALLRHCSAVLIALQQGISSIEEGEKLHAETLSPFVKISNLYWALHTRWQRTKNQEGSDLMRPALRAVEMLRHRSAKEKELGFMTTKLEKVGELLLTSKCYRDADRYFRESVTLHLDVGTLHGAAQLAKSFPVMRMGTHTGAVAALVGNLKDIIRLIPNSCQKKQDEAPYIDDEQLSPEQRGVLLESQLYAALKQITKATSLLSEDFHLEQLIDKVLQIYDEDEFPVRRRRVAAHLLHLETTKQNVVSQSVRQQLLEVTPGSLTAFGKDDGLKKYEEHLNASISLTLTFRKPTPSREDIKSTLSTWQKIVDQCTDAAMLLAYVDDDQTWLAQLRSLVDFCGMKAYATLHIPALKILIRATQLLRPQDLSAIVLASSQLVSRYTLLGYSGKSRELITGVTSMVTGVVTSEAKVQFCLASAEAHLANGDREACMKSLTMAKELTDATEYPDAFTARTRRVQRSCFVSEAAYIASMCASRNGSSAEALHFARLCVTLNRRVWAYLEHDACKRPSAPKLRSDEAGMESFVEGIASLSTNARAPPVVVSMTHESLNTSAFWGFVPSLWRGLYHLASVFDHQGMYEESVYFLDQAQKIANTVESGALSVKTLSKIADIYLRAERVDKASESLEKAKPYIADMDDAAATVMFHAATARLCDQMDERGLASTACQNIDTTLKQAMSASALARIDTLRSSEDLLAEKLASMDLRSPERHVRKPVKTTRVRKAPVKTAGKAPARCKPTSKEESPNNDPSNSLLSALYNQHLCWRVMQLMNYGEVAAAQQLLDKTHDFPNHNKTLYALAKFRSMFTEALQQLDRDVAFNSLLDSTISLPAVARLERGASGLVQEEDVLNGAVPPKRSASPKKKGKAKPAAVNDSTMLLKTARSIVAEVRSSTLAQSPLSVIRQLYDDLYRATILLSAVCAGTKSAPHPLQGAILPEQPRLQSWQYEHDAIRLDRKQPGDDKLLTWPLPDTDPQRPIGLTATTFQHDYLDTIPNTWVVVSVGINEQGNELHLSRYQANQTPFLLRLPMARHKSRDMDEEVFGFGEGKAELLEIIELSNFSTHDTRDMSVKGAKTEWWAEREALDERLHELLSNIDNIWLGGFRGIFSPYPLQPDLLTRFQKSLENIFNRHLPSRQGRGQQKKLNLDPRILELFVGLGNPDQEGIDLDESLTDLVYFVVDILHFDGELNAYDEIDFDSVVVETLDALKSYHAATDFSDMQQLHTILVLDNTLHMFPWESIPSLQKQSISRMPSMTALRELIVKMAPPTTLTESDSLPAGHHIPVRGSSILNPSCDLPQTEKTLSPYLNTLSLSNWTQITAQAPSEAEFETALAESELVLYFGHGSGAQYIRSRAIKKLYRTPPAFTDTIAIDPSSARDASVCVPSTPIPPPSSASGLATTLLFGCSSAALTLNGSYEPSGAMAAYINAGAPAVLGMLWDVTDKDCDRFAVKVGVEWGLWPELEDLESNGRSKKGSKKNAKEKEIAREARTPARGKTPRKKRVLDVGVGEDWGTTGGTREWKDKKVKVGLDEAVTRSRDACYLRYLNGAAPVIYGLPVYLKR